MESHLNQRLNGTLAPSTMTSGPVAANIHFCIACIAREHRANDHSMRSLSFDNAPPNNMSAKRFMALRYYIICLKLAPKYLWTTAATRKWFCAAAWRKRYVRGRCIMMSPTKLTSCNAIQFNSLYDIGHGRKLRENRSINVRCRLNVKIEGSDTVQEGEERERKLRRKTQSILRTNAYGMTQAKCSHSAFIIVSCSCPLLVLCGRCHAQFSISKRRRQNRFATFTGQTLKSWKMKLFS